jgi:tetratricopeptide (TPR) repeat protein
VRRLISGYKLSEMFLRFRSHALIVCALAVSLALLCASTVHAQSDDDVDAAEGDPVRLFQKGQDAHERGKLEIAIQFYDEAIKVRPEFPEAEYQRASALVSLNRLPEAEKGFRRTIELRSDWALPQAMLGSLLVRLNRLDEAEKFLTRALELDKRNNIALLSMTDLLLQKKGGREALAALLERLRSATASDETASAALLAARAAVERALSDKESAMKSLERALNVDDKNLSALMQRAEMRAEANDYEHALEDAKSAQRVAPQSVNPVLLTAEILARAGKKDEALRTLDALDSDKKQLPAVVSLYKSIAAVNTSTAAVDDATPENRAELEKRLEGEPRNAAILARLCVLYRTDAPARALEYCRRAVDIEPRNVDYATGYAAALVQSKRFADAVTLLRRILTVAPDNYSAHANLATALYELRQYGAAIAEYRWITEAKPDMAIAYFFMATSYDYMNQYADALNAYEKFLSLADAKRNQLEIDKVNLRIPTLRNQIKRGEGAKSKKQSN